MAAARREIICADAIPWLRENAGKYESIVTSIPDQTEVNLPMAEYTVFFKEAVRLCLDAVKSTGYCIFLQTDRKYKGAIIPKDYYIIHEALEKGHRLLWHKISMRREFGVSDLHRPTYSHMLCFSKKGGVGKKAPPDVVRSGSVTYANGFGIDAVKSVLQFLAGRMVTEVVDPFVGSGTTVALANQMGMNAIGVDIDSEQCAKSEALAF